MVVSMTELRHVGHVSNTLGKYAFMKHDIKWPQKTPEPRLEAVFWRVCPVVINDIKSVSD